MPIFWADKHARPPPWNRGASCRDLEPEARAFVEKELARAYETGAWEDGTCDLYVSRLFCVPKPNGPPTPDCPEGPRRWRLVLDLRPLNEWCKKHTQKCETLRSLAAMGLTPESLMFSWDLADGFHCCGIEKDSRKYMSFLLFGKLRQISALPFGWTSSPFVFSEIMKVLCKVLRAPDLPSTAELKARPGRVEGTTLAVLKVRGVRKRLFRVDWQPP